MSRDRHSRHKNWRNRSSREEQNQRRDNQNQVQNRRPVFRPSNNAVTAEQIRADEEAIKSFKQEIKFVCEKCGQPVIDIASALASRSGNGTVHFECALKEVEASETLAAGDKVAYIGQGRFGVINYPNVHDVRHFTIRKIIEWDKRDENTEWRNRMSELYSKVR